MQGGFFLILPYASFLYFFLFLFVAPIIPISIIHGSVCVTIDFLFDVGYVCLIFFGLFLSPWEGIYSKLGVLSVSVQKLCIPFIQNSPHHHYFILCSLISFCLHDPLDVCLLQADDFLLVS